ncbi:putative sporulation protein YtxC [Clostridium sp. UBA4548]|uniref:putative sporulation protein YtxC n=1 Tax=Clostridium sp. UBA4548 TaxID=1946361 RepID=UPI0025BD7E38|nr:putative sporulation protein YtxC [Clostridium sp. UBA4548]
MLLLELIDNSNRDYMVEDIKDMITYFNKKNVTLDMSVSFEQGKQLIKIQGDDKKYDNKMIKLINLHLGNVLYKVIIDEFYKNNIGKLLTESFPFLKFDDIKALKEMVYRALRDEDEKVDETVIYFMNRKNNVIEKIVQCLEENNEVNVQGLLTFRMKDFKEDLESIVEKVVEKYMVEKEYNEFIKLLKYFVEVQESKLQEVHIMIDEKGDYIVKDEFGNDILNNLIDELYETKYTAKVTSEDLIISGLITTAPQRVIIHSVHNCINKELIETIKNVFENRVSYCNDCKQCEALRSKAKI